MSNFRSWTCLMKGRVRSSMAAGVLLALALCPASSIAQATLPALTATTGPDGSTYSLSVQTLLMLTAMSFLPAALLMMTGFTRIIIVLGLMRTALGTQTTPPNLVLVGLALFLTAYTMSPVFDQIYTQAYKPLSDGTINFETAIERGSQPLRTFMLHQTRETDLSLFANMVNQPAMESPENVPMKILVPAFVTSELKTAFQIGFTIFIPFLIIDLVIASVLMGLGMMMVPPVTVSLPFKLMLFVLADGWHLLLGSLARSFYQ
jgi:flagellar biosynthetic protein FliP